MFSASRQLGSVLGKTMAEAQEKYLENAKSVLQ